MGLDSGSPETKNYRKDKKQMKGPGFGSRTGRDGVGIIRTGSLNKSQQTSFHTTDETRGTAGN